jgi:hypothetical protein
MRSAIHGNEAPRGSSVMRLKPRATPSQPLPHFVREAPAFHGTSASHGVTYASSCALPTPNARSSRTAPERRRSRSLPTVRRSALGRPPAPVPETTAVFLRELSRIGNNLNQVARFCNIGEGEEPGLGEVARVIEDVLDIIQAIAQDLKEKRG